MKPQTADYQRGYKRGLMEGRNFVLRMIERKIRAAQKTRAIVINVEATRKDRK